MTGSTTSDWSEPMPGVGDMGYGENLSPLIDAWTAHYERKGCSRRKAQTLASARAWKGKRTWP